MQDKDATMVVPTLRPQDKHMQIRPWSDPENRPTRSPLRDQVNGYDRILGSYRPMRHGTRSSLTTAS
jgi:hypothetical protein